MCWNAVKFGHKPKTVRSSRELVCMLLAFLDQPQNSGQLNDIIFTQEDQINTNKHAQSRKSSTRVVKIVCNYWVSIDELFRSTQSKCCWTSSSTHKIYWLTFHFSFGQWFYLITLLLLFRTHWRQTILLGLPQTLQLHCARQWWANMKPTQLREEKRFKWRKTFHQKIEFDWFWSHCCNQYSVLFVFFSFRGQRNHQLQKCKDFLCMDKFFGQKANYVKYYFWTVFSVDCIFSWVWSQNTTICTVSFVIE